MPAFATMSLLKLLRFVFLLIVLVSVIVAIVHPDKSKEAIDANNKGVDLYHAGNLDAAIASYDEAIKLDPKLDNAYSNRGEARLHKGDIDGALADGDQAIALNPNSSSHYNNRGHTRETKGDIDGALVDYNKAIALDPNNAEAYNNRGPDQVPSERYGRRNCRLRQSHLRRSETQPRSRLLQSRPRRRTTRTTSNGAIADYNQALALDPKDSQAYNNRGLEKYRKNDLDAALADYDQAIKFDPSDPVSYDNRGTDKEDKNDLEGAIADFAQAIQLNPKSPKYYNSRGWAEYLNGDFAKAVPDFDQAIKLKPENPDPYLNRAYAQYAGGHTAEAEPDFQKALDLKSTDHDYPRFFICLIKMPDPALKAGAIQELADYLPTRPSDATAWPLQVGLFLTGKLPESDFLKAAQSSDAKQASNQQCEANFYVGIMHELAGDKAGAQPFYQKSVETNVTGFSEYQISRAKLKASQ